MSGPITAWTTTQAIGLAAILVAVVAWFVWAVITDPARRRARYRRRVNRAPASPHMRVPAQTRDYARERRERANRIADERPQRPRRCRMTTTDRTPTMSDINDDVRAVAAVNALPDLLDAADETDRWKDEALPVLAGLQELGQALGLPLGERITCPRAAEAAIALVAEADRLRDELRHQRSTLAGLRRVHGDLVTEADRLRARLTALEDGRGVG